MLLFLVISTSYPAGVEINRRLGGSIEFFGGTSVT